MHSAGKELSALKDKIADTTDNLFGRYFLSCYYSKEFYHVTSLLFDS
jgi:hypothetical protein